MKKYLIFSVCLLALLLAAGLASAASLSHMTAQTQQSLIQARDAAATGDLSTAESAVSRAQAAWKRTEPLLNVLLNHEETDRIHFAFADLDACLQTRDPDALLLRCGELIALMEHLSQLEQPFFYNLL